MKLEVDIAADGSMGERAITEIEQFIQTIDLSNFSKEDHWLISRSQIEGLWYIAVNEPTRVGAFCEKQYSKAEARKAMAKNEKLQELEAQMLFWELIRGLCKGKPPKKFPWSLSRLRDEALPTELQSESSKSGAKLSREEQAALKEIKQKREEWLREWERSHYPVFFQRLCIHYLYEMTKRTNGA